MQTKKGRAAQIKRNLSNVCLPSVTQLRKIFNVHFVFLSLCNCVIPLCSLLNLKFENQFFFFINKTNDNNNQLTSSFFSFFFLLLLLLLLLLSFSSFFFLFLLLFLPSFFLLNLLLYFNIIL